MLDPRGHLVVFHCIKMLRLVVLVGPVGLKKLSILVIVLITNRGE